MKRIMFLFLLLPIILLGCGKVSFYQELEPFSFSLVPTGSIGGNFWSEYGDTLPQEVLGIEYENISFDITITNKLGYDTKLTIALSLIGQADKGEVKLYSSKPSYINSDNENKKFVYILKDSLVPSSGVTNFTSTVSSLEFLSNLSSTTNFWVDVNNQIQGIFTFFPQGASQEVHIKIKVRGYKSLGGSPSLDLIF